MKPSTAKVYREAAIRLLAICASGNGETLSDIARDDDVHAQEIVTLARLALIASLGSGTWREVRALAESRLRCGESFA